MATRTLAQLLTGTRQLANVENSLFVTDAEVTDRINEAVSELYDLVISVYEHYYVSSIDFAMPPAGFFNIVPGMFTVRLATTGAGLPASLASGSGVGKTLTENASTGVLSVDGSSVVLGDRILYRSLSINAGIYVATLMSPGVPWVLTRAPDYDQNTDVALYDLVKVTAGTANIGHTFEMTAYAGILDTSVQTWTDPPTTPPVMRPVYKDNTLEVNPGTSNAARVPRMSSWQERNSVGTRSYVIVGNRLYVYPPLMSPGNYRLWYTPDPPVLSATVDLDGTLGRWYDYVQLRAAIAVLDKREMDSGALASRLAAMRQRVVTMATNRQEEPGQVPLGDVGRGGFWGDEWP